MLKITLLALNSSYSHTNLAVRCIKKSLNDAGFGANYLEFSLKDKRGTILSALFNAGAGVYGFSVYIWNRREMLTIASDLKKLCPAAKIIFGGPEVSFDAEKLLDENPFIDCVITGEGEAAFIKAAQIVESGGELPKVIDGNEFNGFERAGILYDREENSAKKLLYYESARGCPYRCAYCLSALSGRVRAKPAEQVLSELYEFEEFRDIKVIKFVDRTFNFDAKRARIIWNGLLDPKFTKCCHFEICGELLEDEDFELLSRFPKGKIQLEIGVQSTNPETLARVGRKTDIPKLLAAISRLHEPGNIHIHADLIAGLPGESFERFGKSFDDLFGRCDMLQLGFLKLLRGSRLRNEVCSFGCIYSDEPPYEVLATDCLSFNEIELLHRIDDLNERYVNSGAFGRTCRILFKMTDSPFNLLKNLAIGLDNDRLTLREISQANAYSELYDRTKTLFVHSDELLRAYQTALSLDFLTSQKTSLPKFGDFVFERSENPALKRKFCNWADENSVDYFAPALEVRAGRFLLDRKMLTAFEFDGEAYHSI